MDYLIILVYKMYFFKNKIIRNIYSFNNKINKITQTSVILLYKTAANRYIYVRMFCYNLLLLPSDSR